MVSDKTRRDAFIEQNLGLVHACAGRFRGRGMEYDDLYSAGCWVLSKPAITSTKTAASAFHLCGSGDLGRDQKAVPGRRHRQGKRLSERAGHAVQAAREHTMKLCGTEPTLSQLAEQLGESVENVAMPSRRHSPP